MRPYNHPDNIDQNGQPKMSENAWMLYEQSLADTEDARLSVLSAISVNDQVNSFNVDTKLSNQINELNITNALNKIVNQALAFGAT